MRFTSFQAAHGYITGNPIQNDTQLFVMSLGNGEFEVTSDLSGWKARGFPTAVAVCCDCGKPFNPSWCAGTDVENGPSADDLDLCQQCEGCAVEAAHRFDEETYGRGNG